MDTVGSINLFSLQESRSPPGDPRNHLQGGADDPWLSRAFRCFAPNPR